MSARARAALAAVSAWAAIVCGPTADAHAGVTQLAAGSSITAGPVLVGDHTVWTEHGVFDVAVDLRMAAPDGRAITLLRLGAETCDTISDIVGSSVLFVVSIARATRANGNCGPYRRELLVGRPGSPSLQTLTTDPGGCLPRLVDVDAGHIAVLRVDCKGRELAVLDASGAALAELPFDTFDRVHIPKLAIGGDTIALTTVRGGFFPYDGSPQITLFDWRTRRTIADIDTKRPGRSANQGDDWLATDDDGVTVLSSPNDGTAPSGPPTGAPAAPLLDWVSPAAPQAHVIPIDRNPRGLSVQRGAFPAVRADGRMQVVGTDGQVRLELGRVGSGRYTIFGIPGVNPDTTVIDLDDGRIALQREGAVVNDTYPPSPVEPTVVRPSATGGLRVIRGRLTPSAVAPARVEVAIVQLGAGLEPGAVRARAAASGPRRRCKRATSSGRLIAFKPRDGRCRPTRFVPAKGTTAWRVRLGRRLPRGRYAIYARAVDAAGRVGRVTAKDAVLVRVR